MCFSTLADMIITWRIGETPIVNSSQSLGMSPRTGFLTSSWMMLMQQIWGHIFSRIRMMHCDGHSSNSSLLNVQTYHVEGI